MGLAKRHLTRPQVTTLELNSNELISVWVNCDIFTVEGNLKQQYQFTGDEAESATHLVSFEWPQRSKAAMVITVWTPTVKLHKSNQKTDFASFLQSTAENIGLNKWELAKLVMERCLERFDACLLEVTLLGVRLGHKDIKSANEAREREADVTEFLMYLLADTEYQFRDAVVEWTVTVSPGTPTPVQESAYASGQHSSLGSSLVMDSPGSLTSPPIRSAQVEGEFDWRLVDGKQLLVQVLRRMSLVQNILHDLNRKMDNDHRNILKGLDGFTELDADHNKQRWHAIGHRHAGESSLYSGSLLPQPLQESGYPDDDGTGPSASRDLSDNRTSMEVYSAHADDNVSGRDAAARNASQPRRVENSPPGDRSSSPGGTLRKERGDSSDRNAEKTVHVSSRQRERFQPANRTQAAVGAERREENFQGRSVARAPDSNRGQRESSQDRTAVRLMEADDNFHSTRGDPKAKIKESVKENSLPSELAKQNALESPSTPRNNAVPTTPRQNPDPSPSGGAGRPQSPPSGHTRQSLNRTANKPPPPAASNRKPAAANDQQAKRQAPTSASTRQSPSSSSSSSALPPPPSSSSSPSSSSNTAGVAVCGRRGSSTSQQSSMRTQGAGSATSGGRVASGRPDSTKSVSQEMMMIECGSDSEAKLVKESVNRAYLEDEVKPPKASSFDTMLCLDISESMMQGGAFEEMKEAVVKFIDGVEDMVTTSGVEENIGLVTFGGRANVVHNLTNDFSRIRDQIDMMKPGGRSPFVEALLVAMAAFVKKGGIVSVSGEWDVKPRIIFISDGFPTESTASVAGDVASNITNVRLSVSRMLISFKNSDSFNKVYPVIFIPVGQHADKSYMEAMSKICDGVFMKPEKITDLCHYFRVQETIGKVLVCLKRESDTVKADKIEATVTALTDKELSDKEKTEVLETVSRELANPERARSHHRPRPTDLDNVYEDLAKVDEGERLALGTRVIRGPDWEWAEQDAQGPGTVINHHERHSIHWVKWDKADYNCYPYSSRRGYHIWPTDDQPRLRIDNEPLDIGMTVRKGPDWNSAEAQDDQGIGIGVIIRRSKEKGKVMVRWPNGVKQVCRWSLSGPKEVEYCHPDRNTSNVLQSSSTRTEQAVQPVTPNSRSRGEREAAMFEGDGVWQWRDVDNTWRPYDKKTNKEIEAACKKKSGISCLIERDGKQRRVMFRKSVEKVIDEGTECEVRRIPAANA